MHGWWRGSGSKETYARLKVDTHTHALFTLHTQMVRGSRSNDADVLSKVDTTHTLHTHTHTPTHKWCRRCCSIDPDVLSKVDTNTETNYTHKNSHTRTYTHAQRVWGQPLTKALCAFKSEHKYSHTHTHTHRWWRGSRTTKRWTSGVWACWRMSFWSATLRSKRRAILRLIAVSQRWIYINIHPYIYVRWVYTYTHAYIYVMRSKEGRSETYCPISEVCIYLHAYIQAYIHTNKNSRSVYTYICTYMRTYIYVMRSKRRV